MSLISDDKSDLTNNDLRFTPQVIKLSGGQGKASNIRDDDSVGVYQDMIKGLQGKGLISPIGTNVKTI